MSSSWSVPSTAARCISRAPPFPGPVTLWPLANACWPTGCPPGITSGFTPTACPSCAASQPCRKACWNGSSRWNSCAPWNMATTSSSTGPPALLLQG
ncbi:hypothetical protein G6F57_020690 [Rhizopus arrhizus]|nr:hypothetical protein G6F57_020690 [Rhizopus arrhizus]